MHNINDFSDVKRNKPELKDQPLKYQIPYRLMSGLGYACRGTLLLCTTSALFSLPIIVPVVASIAAVHFTLGFFPEIGIILNIPFTFVGNLINLNQLGIAFATKTTLLFNLTSFGIIIAMMLISFFILLGQLCLSMKYMV